jgi:hypothetical protein
MTSNDLVQRGAIAVGTQDCSSSSAAWASAVRQIKACSDVGNILLGDFLQRTGARTRFELNQCGLRETSGSVGTHALTRDLKVFSE